MVFESVVWEFMLGVVLGSDACEFFLGVLSVCVCVLSLGSFSGFILGVHSGSGVWECWL